MVLYAPPEPSGGTEANVIWVPRSPNTKSLAPLTAQERPRSPESQMYIPDGCTHVAGDPAHW